jgi:hypothetical protein
MFDGVVTVPTNLDGLDPAMSASLLPARGTVGDQSIAIPARWWDNELSLRGLPGRPLAVAPIGGAATTRPALSRRQVWELAAGAADDDVTALRLLWHVLAWGAGRHLRMCAVRMGSVGADVGAAVQTLRRAAELAGKDPAAAYEVLYPRGRSAIRGLGPSFGTKFLYFSGGGSPAHPCLILDSYVTTALRRHGWLSLRAGRWSAWTYQRYCALLTRWASILSAAGQPDGAVVPDLIEYWLFHDGR